MLYGRKSLSTVVFNATRLAGSLAASAAQSTTDAEQTASWIDYDQPYSDQHTAHYISSTVTTVHAYTTTKIEE